MIRGQTIRRLAVCVILLFTLTVSMKVNSSPLQQPANREQSENSVSQTCVLSGKVINSDTGEPIPYFHLLHMSNGSLIEHLETDEQGRFHTTAPRGSQRYFRLGRSRRGTYIIDWDRQRQIGSRPFRGLIKDDLTDLVFQVKLWPVKALTGKVVDISGLPVSNASVYVHCDVPVIKTDTAGVFRLQAAPKDRDFDLFVISEDMNQAALVHLKAGTTSSTIHLEPTASYTGRVIDIKGQAVGPFELILGMRLNGSQSDCLQEQIQTHTDGMFTLDGLYPKACYRAWWHPDDQINRTIGEHGEKIIDLRKHKPAEPIEIVVEQYLNTLSGKVVNGRGEPVLGAKIMVLTRHGIQAQHRRYKAVYSDKDGAFRLLNLANGEVLFNIYAKKYKSRHVWALTDANSLDIVLKPPSEPSMCEVWVVDDEGRSVAGAPVSLHLSISKSGKLLGSHTATTNEEGKAEFKITPLGDSVAAHGTLCCDLDGYDLAYNSISDRADSHVKLVLHKTGEHWAGKIMDPEQNPIHGAKLYMTSMNQRMKTPQRTTIQWLDQSHFYVESKQSLLAETNAKGEFILHRFNKKDFVRVMVKAAGFKRQEIDFSPQWNTGTVFQLSSRAAIVKGLLVYESSGRPVPAAEIKLSAYSAQDRNIITDVNGSFVIDDLEAGEYVPVMKASGSAAGKNCVCVPDILIAEPGKTIQVTLKARNGITLKGRLIESRTQQRPSAKRIYLEARLKSGQTVSSDSIDEDGNWELLLPPGDYNLYYSIFNDDILRFIDSEVPLSVTVENKEYENLVLEISDRGSLSLQPASLAGRAMPDFKDLNLSLLPADAENKAILICFFDMNQRPSRHCLTQLSKRTQELNKKEVVVIAVHASKIEHETFNDWIKENQISFTVGFIQGDEEKIKFNWGIKSLPWLILTDRLHMIRMEGFGPDNLDTMIKEMNNVEI